MEHEAYVEMAEAEETHWWFTGRRQVLAAEIARLKLPAGAKILELGSGTGGNLAMLQRFGEVCAVEANAAARAISLRKSAGSVDVQAGSLPDQLPELPRPFDLVCLFDVLEHIEDDAGTLAVVRDLLAPGGIVLITVPAFKKLWGPHDEQLHHKRRYERAELKARLEAVGLRIVKLSYSNMFLFPAAVVLRVAERLRAAKGHKASGTAMLPSPINRSFAAIFGSERFLMERVNLPIGLSLLAVARLGTAPI